VKTRFMITTISVHLTRIAVGDCRDGVLFYTYQEVYSGPDIWMTFQ
jgi:splicing factor 3B subunit 3